MKKILLSILVLFLITVLTFCFWGFWWQETPSLISVSRGEIFTIILESNPGSTGYKWRAVDNKEGPTLIEETYRAPISHDINNLLTGMVGQPGFQFFKFKAPNSPSSLQVVFNAVRGFGSNEIPAASKVIVINVK